MFRAILPIFFFLFGFGFPKKKMHSIYDFLADYKPTQDTTIAPIIVSNHASFLDVFYYWMENTAFLAKANVSDLPLMGRQCMARQSIFIDSHDKKAHSDVISRLNNRLKVSHEGLLPPVTVFPEGTLNNGETLLKFKKGSFCHTYPIKIRCTSFRREDDTAVSYTNIHPFIFISLILSQPTAFCKCYEIEENIDPKWILQKHGIKEDDPEAWKYIAKEIKEIMCFMTNSKSTEQGFKEIDYYEKIDCYAHDKIGGKLLRRNNCGSCKYKYEQLKTKGNKILSAVRSKKL